DIDRAIAQFNDGLREAMRGVSNVRFIDMSDVVATVGRHAAFDHRFYYRGKAPYTPALLNELARRLGAASRGFGAHFYKALVIDCDNTLWGGIIGEDLLDGIKLDPHDYPGNVFWRIQNDLAALERAGVLL